MSVIRGNEIVLISNKMNLIILDIETGKYQQKNIQYDKNLIMKAIEDNIFFTKTTYENNIKALQSFIKFII